MNTWKQAKYPNQFETVYAAITSLSQWVAENGGKTSPIARRLYTSAHPDDRNRMHTMTGRFDLDTIIQWYYRNEVEAHEVSELRKGLFKDRPFGKYVVRVFGLKKEESTNGIIDEHYMECDFSSAYDKGCFLIDTINSTLESKFKACSFSIAPATGTDSEKVSITSKA